MSTTTKERPILFSAPMVLAILAGTKTQTRRVIKSPVPIRSASDVRWMEGSPHPEVYGAGGVYLRMPCPYGIPGERLWVREAWARTDPEYCDERVVYRADYQPPGNGDYGLWRHRTEERSWYEGSWKPSIHMKRADSRITLEITDVRVQRLQEISEEDAQAEGVDPGCLACGENCILHGGCGYCRPDHRDSFIGLWNEINGSGSWDANPWVWAISFQKVEVSRG